jgi:CP family cyanate transporter-like MFS transporter
VPAGTALHPVVVLVALILLAANLRPALAGVGPVIGLIGDGFGLTGSELALLTTLPVLCFGLLAPSVPRLVGAIGIDGAVVLAVAALSTGLLIRVVPVELTLFAGTVLLGCGIAVANVLMPAIVKRDFPTRVGPVTGAYTTVLNLSAALSAAIAAPLSVLGGWRLSLGVWVVPAVLALALWSRNAVRSRGQRLSAPSTGAWRLLRNGRARAIVAFTASQSVIYYSVLSWLPSVYESHGYSSHAAGWLLSIVNVTSAPVALVIPVLASRSRSQVPHVVLVAISAALGIAGVLFVPTTVPVLWVVLIGIGQGGAFPLALTMFVLRTRHAEQTANLSTIAQCLAYLVAACGPLIIGLLHDWTGSWRPGIALLLACAAVELGCGISAGRPGLVDSPPTPSRSTT